MPAAPAPERSSGRLLSIDFWRGLALLTIFVNHMPGNVFERFTHKNVGFSDATEVFVLLAGVAVAFVYAPQFERGRGATGAFRILQRAYHLYMAQIVLIVATAAIIARSVAITGDLRFYEMLHLDVLIHDTVPALIGLATMGLQPAYLNILPLYIVLLLGAPALLWLLARFGAGAMLMASGALYVAAQLFWLHIPTYPSGGWWFLNPFAWQFLFAIGIWLGGVLRSGDGFRLPPLLHWLAIGFAVLAAVWILTGFHPSWNPTFLPRFVWDFDKTNLHLPRLLHALALAYVASLLPVERWLRGARALNPLVVLGRHSLSVFSLGTVLSIAGQMIRTQTAGSVAVDAALVGFGILAQIALAGVLEWHRTRSASASSAAGSRSAR